MQDSIPHSEKPTLIFVLSLLCGFFVLTFAVFGMSLGYGFTLGDDQYLIVTNLFIRGPTLENLRYIFTHYDPELYIPLTFLSYQLNYLLAGLNAGFYHFTNLVLHALNATLVAWLAAMLLKRAWIAVLAGALFCIHPIQTEAVVWIAGRKDLLSTFFVLGSMMTYLRARASQHPAAGHTLRLPSGWYVASIILYALALLSKASVMTLPVILILVDVFVESRAFRKNIITDTLPYFVLAIVFAAIAWMGKGRIVYASSMLETGLMAVKSTVFYLQKIIWPTALSPAYAYHDAISIASPDFFIPLLVLTLIGVLALLSLRWTKWVPVTLVLFLVILAPTFLNFHKGEIMYWAVDRYVYLPMVVIVIAVAGGIGWIGMNGLSWLQSMKVRRLGGIALVGLMLLTLLWKTVTQAKLWAADERLLEESLRHYPDSIAMRIALALIYRETGRTNEERRILEHGMQYRKNVAYYTGLGSIEARAGHVDRARELYELGRAHDPNNPEPLFYLGSLEEQLGNEEKAIALYKGAIALDDSYVAAYNNAGAIQMDRGELEDAENMFRSAIQWNPSFMEGHYNLFQILSYQKRTAEGFPHLLKAYQLFPESSEIGLSLSYQLFERKEYQEARNVVEGVSKQDPENRTGIRLLDLIQQSTE